MVPWTEENRIHADDGRLAGALTLKFLYGYRMDYTAPDPLLDFIDRTMEKVLAALVPGTWLVDAVPICMYSAHLRGCYK